MVVALTLLGDVRWRGQAVVGDRPRALLAALASGDGRAVADERLVALVWGDKPPTNAAKSLQVLVSRTRAACGADAIVRDAAGYRLGVDRAEVDSTRLASLVVQARATLDRDARGAQTLAGEALALGTGLIGADGADEGPLAEIRQAAMTELADARAVLAQASSRVGAHTDALPALEAAHAESLDDESLLADLLRSEASVRGPGTALERFETYRRDVRERLGASPGERLQQVYRELLALDRPQRKGVRHDASSLLGRDRDVEALRGLLASARVVSIVGTGGLGKTRLAHVLARESTQPIVHVVELVGVTSAEDVVAEVGSVLGVRDSVSTRRQLTPAQRSDLRARAAQQLAQTPSLLVIDNCEHLVGAVASLVAFLVSQTADLRVLTTSRAPLGIAAERVYPLGELGVDDGAELFGERTRAVRPGAQLDDEVVRRIVTRLDGLPLAIELAAAKVRAMAVEEIDRRLEDRFALLQSDDRSAPSGHRTLLAVIDWSWNLLDPPEQRALRRLAVFNDGFTLEAAEAALGNDALRAVEGLVDQSLLSVRETPAGVRYRMLETVREFGLLQLAEAGEVDEARTARRRWAVAYALRHGTRIVSADQVASVDALGAEEINLADELRDALANGDRSAMLALLAALGMMWTVRGEHARLLALVGPVADAVEGWTPPPALEATARAAISITLTNAVMTSNERTIPLGELLAKIGPGEEPRLAGIVRVVLAYDAEDAGAFLTTLERLSADADPFVARAAGLWISHVYENSGDPVAAVAAAERTLALGDADDGPWTTAILHHQIAGLTMHLGDQASAIEHAHAALPTMQRLGARDDEIQLRSALVLCAITQGRLDDAEEELLRIDAVDDGDVFGGIAVRRTGRAELALARGEFGEGLRVHRACAAATRELRFPGMTPTGLEPWVLFGESTALAAHALHAAGDDAAHGRELFASLRERAWRLFERNDPHIDIPNVGGALFALGSWRLRHGEAAADDAVRLLVLADRFAYNRSVPTMAWEPVAARAEQLAPGLLAAMQSEHEARSPRELLGEARDLLARLG